MCDYRLGLRSLAENGLNCCGVARGDCGFIHCESEINIMNPSVSVLEHLGVGRSTKFPQCDTKWHKIISIFSTFNSKKKGPEGIRERDFSSLLLPVRKGITYEIRAEWYIVIQNYNAILPVP